jgi:hypothetical protein
VRLRPYDLPVPASTPRTTKNGPVAAAGVLNLQGINLTQLFRWCVRIVWYVTAVPSMQVRYVRLMRSCHGT